MSIGDWIDDAWIGRHRILYTLGRTSSKEAHPAAETARTAPIMWTGCRSERKFMLKTAVRKASHRPAQTQAKKPSVHLEADRSALLHPGPFLQYFLLTSVILRPAPFKAGAASAAGFFLCPEGARNFKAF